jgi:hypothetical protein
LATDGFLMVLLYMIIHRHLRRERLVSGAMSPQHVAAAGEQ